MFVLSGFTVLETYKTSSHRACLSRCVSCMGPKMSERKGERGVHHLESIQRAFVMDTYISQTLISHCLC